MKDLPGDTSIREFLRAVASAEGAHGAISVSAVAGGLGASLLLMVAALPKTRADSAADRTKLIEAATALSDIQEQLMEAVETDTAVQVFAARNIPEGSPAQRAERQAAMQIALRAAADVPLEVMRLCARGLKHAEAVAGHSIPAASADIQLGAALLHAALVGARSHLEVKISSLTDTQYVTSVADEIAFLSEQATVALGAAERIVQVPPA